MWHCCAVRGCTRTYVEDSRNFLLQTPDQYDIITTDATHPVNTSSWALFA
ncbi:MAG: hypothetical protein R3A44_44620 [Caldilineaceae bacterium]